VEALFDFLCEDCLVGTCSIVASGIRGERFGERAVGDAARRGTSAFDAASGFWNGSSTGVFGDGTLGGFEKGFEGPEVTVDTDSVVDSLDDAVAARFFFGGGFEGVVL